jgi:PIN domain nuclease of toxin-antitoxin system
MADYLADTHSLLWYFTRPQRLGPDATAAFAEIAAGTANLIVPVIVLAELILIVEHKPISADFDHVLRQLQASSNVSIADLSLARILDLRTLTAIPDMHDRFIVAEALARGATLITHDQTITASGLVPVMW